MHRFVWIITLPITIVVVIFAIANRHDATLVLWPLERTVEVPMFLVIFLSLLIGLLAGGSISWLGTAKKRLQGRRAKKEVKRLSEETLRLRSRLEQMEDAAAKAKATAGATATLHHLPAAKP